MKDSLQFVYESLPSQRVYDRFPSQRVYDIFPSQPVCGRLPSQLVYYRHPFNQSIIYSLQLVYERLSSIRRWETPLDNFSSSKNPGSHSARFRTLSLSLSLSIISEILFSNRLGENPSARLWKTPCSSSKEDSSQFVYEKHFATRLRKTPSRLLKTQFSALLWKCPCRR